MDTLPEEVANRVCPRKKAGESTLSANVSLEFKPIACACGSDRQQNTRKTSPLMCDQNRQNHSRLANLVTRL